jgi:nicotinamide-nucleotide amidase
MSASPPYTRLRRQAREAARLLESRRQRLVLAESCSGGLIASLLTEVPEISNVFCGSTVVYREASKRAWLGVGAADLRKYSAVSREVSEAMVRGVLRNTSEATIAGSITGYLGPSGKEVGLVYFSVFRRGDRAPTTLRLEIGNVLGNPESARALRREIAVGKFFELLIALLKSNRKTGKRV